MVAFFQYRSPTTPGNPGWAEGLGNDTVRLASIQGVVQEAQLGAVGISSIVLDDPDADVGHSGDAVVGLKQFDWTENAAPSGRRRIWTGYIGDRRYRRGDEQRRSLILASSRIIDVTLVDINTFLSFRRFSPEDVDATSSFDRPAESDIARVTALLAVDFLSTTLFDGLVTADNPVNMDAADYTGRSPADVLNDCAQQSGKNYFVFYDEAGTYTSAGNFGLFYDLNASLVYPSNCNFSNVRADWDSDTFGPMMNAELRKDPSRIRSEVILAGDGVTVRRDEDDVGLTTSATYGWRTEYVTTSDVKTVAVANARADRYLRENATEDETITFSIFLPAANVNDWMPGQYGTVRLQHLPGYSTATNVRCVRRSVAQVEDTPDWYTVTYEMTPMAAVPVATEQQAYAFYVEGSGVFAKPTLEEPTTPGNRLLAAVVVHRKDAPPGTDSPSPVFRDADDNGLQTWTTLAEELAYSGTQFPGPGGNFRVGLYHREVAVGEATTTPTVASPNDVVGGYDLGVWLWELSMAAPTSTTTLPSTNVARAGTATLGSAMAGFKLGIMAIQCVNYGARWTATVTTGTELFEGSLDNDPGGPYLTGTNGPTVVIATLDTNDNIEMTINSTLSGPNQYNHGAVAGVAAVLPGITELTAP